MRWYHYFNKKGEENLLESEFIEEENLLVCQQLKYRRYCKFENFSKFSRYFLQQEQGDRCFYEMMREKEGRKPYFDIDIDDVTFDYKTMLGEIKDIILSMIGKKIKILVFDSSTEKKLSFHIVVDDVFLQSYKELLCFFDRVEEKMKEEHKVYMDRSVYKSVQQFRIVGSHKFMKENTKTFREDLSYRFSIPKRIKTEIGNYNYLLSSSLVTNVSYCRVLCGFQLIEKESVLDLKGSANEGDIEDVMKIFYSKYSYGDFSFQECKEKNGNLLIILKRLNATFCELCKRVHESENPYITVTGDFRNITFYCRRTNDKEIKLGDNLGYLGIPNYSDLKSVEPPVIENLGETIQMTEIEEIEEPKTDNLEEILEDIASETKVMYTPKRKKDIDGALRGLNLKNLLY